MDRKPHGKKPPTPEQLRREAARRQRARMLKLRQDEGGIGPGDSGRWEDVYGGHDRWMADNDRIRTTRVPKNRRKKRAAAHRDRIEHFAGSSAWLSRQSQGA